MLNAAYQKNREGIETLETDEFDRVFRTNLYSHVLVRAAGGPRLEPVSIIVTASDPGVQSLARAFSTTR